jgi:hypothetical protein
MMIKFISFGEQKKNGLTVKKGERWGQNGIKKKWDCKYLIPFLFQNWLENITEGGDFQILFKQNERGKHQGLTNFKS